MQATLGAHLAGGVTPPPRETGKACISISKSSALYISLDDEASGVEFIRRMQSLTSLTDVAVAPAPSWQMWSQRFPYGKILPSTMLRALWTFFPLRTTL